MLVHKMARLRRKLRLKITKMSGKENIIFETRWGYRFQVRFVDHTILSFYNGSYEPEETEIIEKLVKPGMTVLDIGANIGWFSLLLAHHVGNDGKVHAFEANPSVIQLLKNNIALNSKLLDGKQIFCHQVAIGAEDGDADFYCPAPGEEGLGGLQDTARTPQAYKIKAPMTTLDHFIAKERLTKVHFMKMDIEGGEYDALKGGLNLLDNLRPIILLEACDINAKHYGYRVFELLSFLENHGYTTTQVGLSYSILAMPR